MSDSNTQYELSICFLVNKIILPFELETID